LEQTLIEKYNLVKSWEGKEKRKNVRALMPLPISRNFFEQARKLKKTFLGI
jgi:hypothetical protein